MIDVNPKKLRRFKLKWAEVLRLARLRTKYESAARRTRSKPLKKKFLHKAAKYRCKEQLLARVPL